MTHIRSFRVHPFSNGLMPSKDVVSSARCPTSDSPAYGDQDPTGLEVCSGTYQCRGKDKSGTLPDGVIGLSFDNLVGDPDASPRLYGFLKERDQNISHFMIGANIRDCPQTLFRALQELEGLVLT